MHDQIPQSATIADSDYVIFGGTGDLALRKIFPALFWRYIDGQIGDNFRLIATSRKPVNLAEFAERLRPFCADALAAAPEAEAVWEKFIQLVSIQIVDIASGEGAEEMAKFLLQEASETRPLIYYLAVAPALFGPSCQLLQKAGLALPQSRVVVEKPLGHDYLSA